MSERGQQLGRTIKKLGFVWRVYPEWSFNQIYNLVFKKLKDKGIQEPTDDELEKVLDNIISKGFE